MAQMDRPLYEYRIRYKQLLKGSRELYEGELEVIKDILDKYKVG